MFQRMKAHRRAAARCWQGPGCFQDYARSSGCVLAAMLSAQAPPAYVRCIHAAGTSHASQNCLLLHEGPVMRAGAPSFRALLARVRGAVRGALNNADVPFSMVVADVRVPRSAAYSPLFQNLCVLQDAAFGDLPALDGTTSQALQAHEP